MPLTEEALREAAIAAAADAAETARVARGFVKAPASVAGAPAVLAPRSVVAARSVELAAFEPHVHTARVVWSAAAAERRAEAERARAEALARAAESRSSAPPALSFKARQLTMPRVRLAYRRSGAVVDSVLTNHGLSGRVQLRIRVFKHDRVVELWGRRSSGMPFVKLREYAICEISGRPGPKRREGDTQVPEGFYTIDALNPTSDYHLSLHVNYPNLADRTRPGRARNLGGQIFIHGGCASVGCIAITDRNIEELYAFIVEARNAGQRAIPIAIFPVRMDDQGVAWLSGSYGVESPDYSFWMNLKEGYDRFQRTRRLPLVGIDGRGGYTFPARGTSD